jgi:hypothetical protein
VRRSTRTTASATAEPAVEHPAAIDEHDHERDRGARVAARHQAERLVRERDHERGRQRDRDGDVDDRDREVARRSLLDAIEADRRLVHEADPEAQAREQPERLLAVPEQVRCRDRRRERGDRRRDEAGDRRRRERRANDGGARLALPLEREAEERVDEPELRDRDGDRDEGRQRLDDAVVGRSQVVGVERQQEQRREARDDGPEPVHQRLAPEAQQAARDALRRWRSLHG